MIYSHQRQLCGIEPAPPGSQNRAAAAFRTVLTIERLNGPREEDYIPKRPRFGDGCDPGVVGGLDSAPAGPC